MRERTHFEREISMLRRDTGPQRNYDISGRLAKPPRGEHMSTTP